MQYSQFLNNTTKTWLLADGGGQTKLGTGCAHQTPGNPMLLSLNPGGKPYMDAYWYLQCGPLKAQTVIYDLQFKFPTMADYQACTAVEFEIRDDSVSEEEDGGWQALFTANVWRLYDFSRQKWVSTGIPLNPQQWLDGVQVGAVYSIVEGQSANDGLTFQGLLVNGVWSPVGALEVAVHTSSSPKFNVAVQADGNGKGDAFSLLVGQADVRTL